MSSVRTPGLAVGGPQIWQPKAISLGWQEHVALENTAVTAKFRIYTPDSRLRVKATLLFLRDNLSDTSVAVSDCNATLYLGAEDHDSSGKLGADLLVTDILRDSSGNVIHQSAPLTIPEDTGLEGFSTEFVTAADSVLGIFQTTQNGPTGHWILQVRYQPDGQRLCDQDWDLVQRKCHPILLGPEFNLPAD